MPRLKEPYIAKMDEVKISRNGESAGIDYIEAGVAGVNLVIGKKVDFLSDADILEIHNNCLRRQHELRLNYKHTCYETPTGKPQIKFSKKSRQWTLRGDVVRALIEDSGNYYNGYRVPNIEIDGNELTWAEFGSLISTFAGWGMRVTFVPDDELNQEPRIIVKEHKKDDKGFKETLFPYPIHE